MRRIFVVRREIMLEDEVPVAHDQHGMDIRAGVDDVAQHGLDRLAADALRFRCGAREIIVRIDDHTAIPSFLKRVTALSRTLKKQRARAACNVRSISQFGGADNKEMIRAGGSRADLTGILRARRRGRLISSDSNQIVSGIVFTAAQRARIMGTIR